MEEQEVRKLSLEDVVNETAKPIMIPVPAVDGEIPYIRPSQKEIDVLMPVMDKVVKEKADIIRAQEQLNCYDGKGKLLPGKVLYAEKEIKMIQSQIRSDYLLFAGLKKADSNITREQFEQLSPDIKSQMSLYLTKISYGGLISDEEIGGLKNLLELSREG